MDLGLHGSRALITRGKPGHRLTVADALAAEGAVVGLIARDATALQSLSSIVPPGTSVATEVADVMNTGALNWAVDEIGAALGVLADHWWPTRAARSAETLPIPVPTIHRDFSL